MTERNSGVVVNKPTKAKEETETWPFFALFNAKDKKLREIRLVALSNVAERLSFD